MKKLFDFLRNKHGLLFKVLLFVIAVAGIVFIFPREGKFKYEFQKGKPWPHEDLIAPFNFPIYKLDKQLEDERNEVYKNHKPYFFKEQKVREEALKELNDRFPKAWAKVDKESGNFSYDTYYLKTAERFLNQIYKKGIIELHESVEDKSEEEEINVLIDNVAEEVQLKDVYTIQEVFEKLNSAH